jgi:hypothetical protein
MCDLSSGEDEIRMTFQVALVGKDGFVIASDRKATRGGELNLDLTYKMRTSSDTRKILVSENDNLVCAYAGNQLVPFLAERLVKSLKDGVGSDTSARLQEKIGELFAGFNNSRFQENISGELIVAVPGTSQLWEVSFIVGQTVVRSVSNHLFGGDRSNPGVYFAERYNAEITDRPVDELKLLAAFTVLEGGFLNQTGVGGLDVLVSKHGEKPRFLEDEELQPLRDRAESLHNILTAEIFGQH